MTAPELLARRFHNLYEHMAPQFGYTTREDTRLFIPESPNGKLMIAVCEALASSPEVAALIAEARREERDRLDAVTNTLSEMWEGEQTARHSAEADITTYQQIVADMTQEAEAAEAELATLRAQNERLTGSLRFYADFHENPNDGPWGVNSQDFGKEARAALTEGAAP